MIRPPPRSPLSPSTTLFRSLDMVPPVRLVALLAGASGVMLVLLLVWVARARATRTLIWLGDRKSTRLNSSHSQISYAVFCLKKKKQKHAHTVPSLQL